MVVAETVNEIEGQSALSLLATVMTMNTSLAGVTIETDTFRLELKGDWRGDPSCDPEQFQLRSEERDVDATVSTVTFSETADLRVLTEKLRGLRLDAEEGAARRFNRQMEIADPLIVEYSRGWQLQYFGRDNTGRHFRYFALVFPGKLLNLFVESGTANFEELDSALQEVFSGLQF